MRTLYSGISAGTELATYRGTNPYLEKHWDAGGALFLPGKSTFHYPIDVWGYSEVGEIEAAGRRGHRASGRRGGLGDVVPSLARRAAGRAARRAPASCRRSTRWSAPSPGWAQSR